MLYGKLCNVKNMNRMFALSKIETVNLSSFDTSKVTNMSWTFMSSSFKSLDLSNFDTSKVTSMSYMFAYSSFEKLNLSSFNTSNVVNMSNMFEQCKKLKTIYASNRFVTDNVTSSSGMFRDSLYLKSGAGTSFSSSHTDKEYARIDGGTSSLHLRIIRSLSSFYFVYFFRNFCYNLSVRRMI